MKRNNTNKLVTKNVVAIPSMFSDFQRKRINVPWSTLDAPPIKGHKPKKKKKNHTYQTNKLFFYFKICFFEKKKLSLMIQIGNSE